MEENEKVTTEPAEDAKDAIDDGEQSEDGGRARELRSFGRAIAEELRGVIDEELDRRFAAMAEADAEQERDTALRTLARDPRFLRILSERLALEREKSSAAAPSARRRGSGVLPAASNQSPQTLDDAKSAARKYFRID